MKRQTGSAPEVRWGWLDAGLASVAPRIAARRYAARVTIANLRRGYEAAARGRGTDGWRASGTAADAEIATAGPVLRDRMRELVRNNPLAAQAVQVLVNNIVGPGIEPRAVTGDEETDRRIDALWAGWAKRCDAHGHTDFQGVLGLAVREMIEGGEVFAVKRARRRRGGEVPLEIELREADHLDAARFEDRPGGGRISQGIEYDRNGRRAAFWMFPDHPGNRSPVFQRTLESVRVPASMVAHLFERQRVQSRGVPWGAPAMLSLRDLGDWQNAELVRKKTEACMVGIVFGAEDEGQQSIAPSVEDSDGNRIEQFEPGLIAYARGGKDIKFNQPGSSAGIREWNMVQMHVIAAGFRVPYALMTGDLSQTNFSSSRVGINEFRRMIEQQQWHTVIPMFCERVWEWFCEAAWSAGLIASPDIPVEWAPPRFESVNPWQDAQTDLLETRAGFTSLSQQIAKRGYDPRSILQEQASVLALADELDLVLDSDPRRVTRAGLAQANAPGEEEPDPPAGGNQKD
ncbi:phage portal protein [Pseudoruegeria sp. M32A2M]|nr:phage portal protein [Pseudoruegeria sp. M32A2M]